MPKHVIAQHVEKMNGVGEIVVEVHRLDNGRPSTRSAEEKSKKFDEEYNQEVHLKSIVKETVSEAAM
jgi:hypothetical protein